MIIYKMGIIIKAILKNLNPQIKNNQQIKQIIEMNINKKFKI